MTNDNWWRGCVIYQIYPRSFLDTDNNGIGDLNGILQKMEYIASLGVDAIWISPFFKSPMKDYGYDVADYKSVDPIFGNLDDFKMLLERAHQFGLKVLVDMVWSHTSDQHDWFIESRSDRTNNKADWYVWADCKPDGTPPNNWLSYFGGAAWTWHTKREQYYLHHFLSSQPTLNLWNDEVQKAIFDTADFWLNMGVDGFRIDAAHAYMHDPKLQSNPAKGEHDPWPSDMPSSNPMARQHRIYSMCTVDNIIMIENIRAHIDKYENRCLLGEVGGNDSESTAISYVQGSKGLHFAYTTGLLGSHMSRADIANIVERVESKIKNGWLCWSTSNHDFKRVVSRMNPPAGLEPQAALLNMAISLSLRGSYCMYQGEELGLPQAELAFEDLRDPYDNILYPEHAGRDGARTPMPWNSELRHAGFTEATGSWLPVFPSHIELSVDLQEKNKNSVLNKYRDFLSYRKNSPILKFGNIKVITAHSDLLIFERELDGNSIICIYNVSPTPESLELTTLDLSDVSLIEEISYGSTLEDLHLSFDPYGYVFLEIKK